MQVVRLKNELAPGIFCFKGIDAKPAGRVGTLSCAAESPAEAWPVLNPVLARAVRCSSGFAGDFRSPVLIRSLQSKPILFFILPRNAMQPAITHSQCLVEGEEGDATQQLLR